LVNRNPPYEYEWSWQSAFNNPSVNRAASGANGHMALDLVSDLNNPSIADARAAIGIYFRPPTENGILTLSTTPSFNASFFHDGTLASSQANAWIGLYGASYNASNDSFASEMLNQMSMVFSVDTWYFSGGDDPINPPSFNNSGFPLTAQFQVDNSHWYALWVWCGTHIRAEGFGGLFSGSAAITHISVNVASMIWSYAG
jgi:hypothetical protein